MSLTLKFGSTSVDLTNASDLVSLLTANIQADLKFIDDPSNFVNQTLQAVGTQGLSLSFATSLPLSWKLGSNGIVNCSFSSSVTGTVSIQTAGTLFKYRLGDDDTAVSIPAETGYVTLTLNVGLKLALGAKFSDGAFGVSGNASDESTFAVSYRKAFPLNTQIIPAIIQAFEAFIFPFQPTGINRMGAGDFLDYEYLGSIRAGFGITYGVSGNMLAGRSASEISKSFGTSPLAKAVVNSKPSFQVAASFAFAYDHEDVFHVIVRRSSQAATLLYFRSGSNSVQTTETLGIKLNLGTTFNLKSSLPSAAKKIASSALSGLTGPLGQSAVAGLTTTLANDASGAVQKYIDDINNSVNAQLAKGNGQTIRLQLDQEAQSTTTALFAFEFDLTQPAALSTGYGLAIKGDFVSAIQVQGVNLDPGSYVEKSWLRTSSVSFQFFDLFKVNDTTQYFNNSKLIYAGDGKFRLMVDTGVNRSITINSGQNSCEVFFTASAPTDRDANVTGDLVVLLNFTMIDHTSASAQETRRALNFIGGGAMQQAAAAIPTTLTGILTVKCQFTEAAFKQFVCDEFIGDTPSLMPHRLDALNYSTFVGAVNGIVSSDSVEQDFFRLFAAYDSWATFNLVKWDREGSLLTPDRKQIGNEAVSIWPDQFANIDTSERSQLQAYIYPAQSFMNLCQSLKHLGQDIDAGAFDDNFKLLQASLTDIIKQNISVFFIKSALAALFRLSQCSSAGVQLTQKGGNTNISFVADPSFAAGSALGAVA